MDKRNSRKRSLFYLPMHHFGMVVPVRIEAEQRRTWTFLLSVAFAPISISYFTFVEMHIIIVCANRLRRINSFRNEFFWSSSNKFFSHSLFSMVKTLNSLRLNSVFISSQFCLITSFSRSRLWRSLLITCSNRWAKQHNRAGTLLHSFNSLFKLIRYTKGAVTEYLMLRESPPF